MKYCQEQKILFVLVLYIFCSILFFVLAPSSFAKTQKEYGKNPHTKTSGRATIKEPHLPGEEFRVNYFGKRVTCPPKDPAIAMRLAKAQGAHKQSSGKTFPLNDSVSVYGKPVSVPDTAIQARRTVFPGGKDTLSQMDENEPTQVNLKYKIGAETTTKIAINAQDKNSPIYTPLKKDEGLNAAGVYLDVGVAENVTVQMGGEVRSNETEQSSSEKTSSGAKMGLTWSF